MYDILVTLSLKKKAALNWFSVLLCKFKSVCFRVCVCVDVTFYVQAAFFCFIGLNVDFMGVVLTVQAAERKRESLK